MSVFPDLKRGRWQYKPVPQEHDRREPSKQYHNRFLVIILCLVVSSLIAFGIFLAYDGRPASCQAPPKRKEWRSLNPSQQQEYISAVQCLMHKPSPVEPGTSLYDDFAYTHVKDGAKSHYAGAFLAWHRYFIHLYEKALVEECGLKMPLPYWDWSLDSMDLSASPIWNNQTGFGGNGDLSAAITLYEGHCVVDGPFANTTRHWLYQQMGENEWTLLASPHCLSRGFTTAKNVDDLHSRISPEQIEETLREQNYSEFFIRLENSTHNAIPQFIMGDFYSFTAPNDPVFFLHHTQVDRLWWIWQQRDPGRRLHEFSGPRETFMHMDNRESSLDDTLYAGTIGKNIQVKDVMSTDTALLCYNY